jgi:alpha-tubulin suppressor-like RCC1 family protein
MSEICTVPVPGLVAAGNYHRLAVTPEGGVLAWGDNSDGQAGNDTPWREEWAAPVVGLPEGSPVVAVAAGPFHSLALGADGTAYGWGYNSSGQLGDGSVDKRPHPARVDGLPAGTRLTAVSTGKDHTAAVDGDGRGWAWGANGYYGQLGDGTLEQRLLPVQVAGLPGGTRLTGVAAGHGFTVAVDQDGRVWAWGTDFEGQLGDGWACDRRPVPAPVEGPWAGRTRIVQVAAGIAHGVALGEDGRVYGWGRNTFGQLGDGTREYRPCPVRAVGLPPDVRMVQVAAGASHTVAIDQSGRVWAWGSDQDGALGEAMGPKGPSGMDLVEAALQAAGLGSLEDLPPGPARSGAIRLAAVNAGRAAAAANAESDSVEGAKLVPGLARLLPDGARAVSVAAGLNVTLAMSASGEIAGAGREPVVGTPRPQPE